MVKGLSSIRSVIIQAQVINKIGQQDDRVAGIWVVWSQEWLQTELDNTKFCYQLIMTIAKICNILGFFKSKHVKFRVFFAAVKKKAFMGEGDGAYVLSNYLAMTCTVLLHCPSQSDLRILL